VITDDEIDKWVDATCNGWDPAADGWGPSEFDDLETGPPLSVDELRSARADLACWRSPADFRLAVHKLHKRCRAQEFKSPRRKFLLDAWTMAEFVSYWPVDEVRLADASERWPDGYVKIGETIENVEATIALMPGRRMWEAGEDIVTISRRLGHASATITLGTYAHLVSVKDGAAAAIEAVLRGETKW
jgi:hypothetical protein